MTPVLPVVGFGANACWFELGKDAIMSSAEVDFLKLDLLLTDEEKLARD